MRPFNSTRPGPKAFPPGELGPLESAVMEIVWRRGESSVREVAESLDRSLAYTTVMTTLDRLYKKRLLDRRKSDRAFVYAARVSAHELEARRAGDLLAGFLGGSRLSRDSLVSCLIDAVGEQDEAILVELERRIRAKREQLEAERKPR